MLDWKNLTTFKRLVGTGFSVLVVLGLLASFSLEKVSISAALLEFVFVGALVCALVLHPATFGPLRFEVIRNQALPRVCQWLLGVSVVAFLLLPFSRMLPW